MRTLVAASIAAALAVAVTGCDSLKEALFTPKVRVKCRVMEGVCIFQNYGDPGEACVVVELFHKPTGKTVRSIPVCSDHLDRDDERAVQVVYPGGMDPVKHCMGEDLKTDFAKGCDVKIIETEPPANPTGPTGN